MKQIDLSGLSFSELIRRDKYYVDKTLLVKDLLSTNDRGVFLFTRPRRFGKTTNLSMLDAFFNIEYRGNDWFDGLLISKYPEYDSYRNSFPVIHLDMRASKKGTYDGFVYGMKCAISEVFKEHKYLLESDIPDSYFRRLHDRIVNREATDEELRDSLLLLSKTLEEYHGRKVIILIDEYDCAVADSFGQESHRPMLDFLRDFLGLALKGNSSLQMAYMTGVMQIAKESLFSDLNNISVNNILSEMSDERFGFTKSEVRDILSYYGHPEKFDEAREWYDGYRFGDAEVYNPFSIMAYVQNGFKPDTYWVNSGSQNIIRTLLEHIDNTNLATISNILTGSAAAAHIETSLAFGDLYGSDESLLSLMTTAGYLNAVPRDDGLFDIFIPNKEIWKIVDDTFRRMNPVDPGDFARFNGYLISGDAEKMATELESILKDESYLTLRNEYVYQAILVTILHQMRGRYEIRAEYEAGNGRADIFLRPLSPPLPWIIMELKVVKSDGMLDKGLDEAMDQIRDRRYSMGLSGKTLLVGMSFFKKVPKVRTEIIDN